MLFHFGFAWPFNIYKSYKVRANINKSLLLLIAIWTGIFHKALSPDPDFVIWLYVINIIMVSINLTLYYRNRFVSDHGDKYNNNFSAP